MPDFVEARGPNPQIMRRTAPFTLNARTRRS